MSSSGEFEMLGGDFVVIAEIAKPRKPGAADVDDASLDDAQQVGKAIIGMVAVYKVGAPASD